MMPIGSLSTGAIERMEQDHEDQRGEQRQVEGSVERSQKVPSGHPVSRMQDLVHRPVDWSPSMRQEKKGSMAVQTVSEPNRSQETSRQ